MEISKAKKNLQYCLKSVVFPVLTELTSVVCSAAAASFGNEIATKQIKIKTKNS